MKLFISWSGELSHQVALVFRDWLPSVIQTITPYVSSEDIEKGARWSSDVSHELQASSYGILCVNRDNINAPWLNFEAGALSKAVDTSRVSPFLLGLKRSEVSGPLLQFQSTIYEKDDLRKLVFTLNSLDETSQLTDTRLEEIFDVWWSRFQTRIDPLQAQAESASATTRTPSRSQNEILEEILELTRSQQKILSNPGSFLPSLEYLEYISRHTFLNEDEFRFLLRQLGLEWRQIFSGFQRVNTETPLDLKENFYRMDTLVDEILHRTQIDSPIPARKSSGRIFPRRIDKNEATNSSPESNEK